MILIIPIYACNRLRGCMHANNQHLITLDNNNITLDFLSLPLLNRIQLPY